MTLATPRKNTGAGFVHEAVLYRNEREYLAETAPSIRAALGADEPVLVAVPGTRIGLVRDALGHDGFKVQFGNIIEDGANPGRIIPAILRRFTDAHQGRRVLMIVESTWPERSVHAYTATVQHEALINLAFAAQPVTILCPYNLTELPEQTLADVERTHPTLRYDGTRRDNPRYTTPQAVVEAIYEQQPAPPADAEVLEFTVVSHARDAVHDWAQTVGLPAERVTDLVIAISEIGGNSIVHGGDGATLLRWTEEGWLVCEIRDQGQIADPLAGRLPPPAMMESGRGLLMVNYLCDLVQLKTGPSGTAIRLWMHLPSA